MHVDGDDLSESALVKAAQVADFALLALELELLGIDSYAAMQDFPNNVPQPKDIPHIDISHAVSDQSAAAQIVALYFTIHIRRCLTAIRSVLNSELQEDGTPAVSILARSLYEASIKAKYFSKYKDKAQQELREGPSRLIRQYARSMPAGLHEHAKKASAIFMRDWASPRPFFDESGFADRARDVLGKRFDIEFGIRYGFPSAYVHSELHLLVGSDLLMPPDVYVAPGLGLNMLLVLDSVVEHCCSIASEYAADWPLHCANVAAGDVAAASRANPYLTRLLWVRNTWLPGQPTSG